MKVNNSWFLQLNIVGGDKVGQSFLSTTLKDSCSGCGICRLVCPQKCIDMDKDEEGFFYPRKDKTKCVECGVCEKICPMTLEGRPDISKITPLSYGGWNRNGNILAKSTSGGIFTSLAEAVIKQGGVVFGCAYLDNNQVKHISVNAINELDKLRGSKYAQSDLGDSFVQVKAELKRNKRVLYSGTPCQIAALRNYIKDNNDNLLLVDVVCHGVPSQVALDYYVKELEKTHNSKVNNLAFRDKRKYGWKHSLSYDYNNNGKQKYVNRLPYRSEFYYLYLHNYLSRYSCYKCPFASLERQGDITLADFWGVKQIAKHRDIKRGISLILTNTNKGVEVLSSIQNNIILKETNIEAALKANEHLMHPSSIPNERIGIYHSLYYKGYRKLYKDLKGTKRYVIGWLKEAMPDSIKQKIKEFIKR